MVKITVKNSPLLPMGNLFRVTAADLVNAKYNALTGQEQTNMSAQAATTSGLATLYWIDTASDGIGTKTIYYGHPPEQKK